MFITWPNTRVRGSRRFQMTPGEADRETSGLVNAVPRTSRLSTQRPPGEPREPTPTTAEGLVSPPRPRAHTRAGATVGPPRVRAQLRASPPVVQRPRRRAPATRRKEAAAMRPRQRPSPGSSHGAPSPGTWPPAAGAGAPGLAEASGPALPRGTPS